MPNSINIDLSTIQPKQAIFFKSRKRYIAYGGARGGGKSWALRKKLSLMALRFPGIRILLLRRTLPELRENHINTLSVELKGIAIWKESEKLTYTPTRLHFWITLR